MKENIESHQERILSHDEIMNEILAYSERAILIRELSDELGVYLLEARETSENDGEYTDYIYLRKGDFPNRQSALKTVLYKVFFENDFAVAADHLQEFDESVGAWIKL